MLKVIIIYATVQKKTLNKLSDLIVSNKNVTRYVYGAKFCPIEQVLVHQLLIIDQTVTFFYSFLPDNRGVATKLYSHVYVCVCEHSKWVDITILKSDTTAISHATCKKNDFFLYNTKGGDESSQNGQKMSRQVLQLFC